MRRITSLPQRLQRLPWMESLCAPTSSKGVLAQIEGLTGPAKSLWLAQAWHLNPMRALVITHHSDQAYRLHDDLLQYGLPDDRLLLLPVAEGSWLRGEKLDPRVRGERILALTALAGDEPVVVIATAEAAFQRTGLPEDVIDATFTLSVNDQVEVTALLERLVAMGYQREEIVSAPGQFSRRGGIVDIFSAASDLPCRIELFGDDIESIRRFDVATQRSVQPVTSLRVLSMREFIITDARVEAAAPQIMDALRARKLEFVRNKNREGFDRIIEVVEEDLQGLRTFNTFDGVEEYLPFLVPKDQCALDFLAVGDDLAPPLIVLDEPGQIEAHWERVYEELSSARDRRFESGEILSRDAGHQRLDLCLERVAKEFPAVTLVQFARTFEHLTPRKSYSVSTGPIESCRADYARFASETTRWIEQGGLVAVVSDQPHRVGEICVELKLAPTWIEDRTTEDSPEQVKLPPGLPESGLVILHGRLRTGYKWAEAGLFVVTDAELFGTARPIFGKRKIQGGIPISTVLDLRDNDYVVHVHHGIGRYKGLVKRVIDGAERDYLMVQYQGADVLYVPADQIDRVQRYIGGESAPPVINRIGGTEWAKTTRKVKEQSKEMARELVELYAAREAASRPSYGHDSPWQQELEEAFPYEETAGQLNAINAVKEDLASDKPMDRLVCGDVGFGKTEVAIRAAFKVLDAGKQVAILCPTTILAAQHHTTFTDRLAPYPFKVELLSRYRSPKEQREVMEGLKLGTIDLVVGTHRILSKDLHFKDLGLIIIDEEQRFGVGHKERLKQMRKSVDVLTLTATPIPRTLSMALSGLREMSVIEDPPSGRLPITTYVRPYNEDVIRDAILRELERDGQIFVVHNRVESIDSVATRIARLVPQARIGVGHGQMSEDELEKLMFAFYHQEIDILVSTTIIENGLDVPNVNTIIVDNADKMGLAQLFQLRGRVGRSHRQAYAYLFYRRDKQMTEEAERRLEAIREFTALGSGFQIAMRDLEIRGAGNLLGSEQSGLLVSVGYDLYCKLLSEAIKDIRGEETQDRTLPPIDVPVTAHVPSDYVTGEAERIYLYKRMAAVSSVTEIEALREEMEDRYGDPPKSVWNALAVLRLRLRAQEIGIASVRCERTEVTLRLNPPAKFSTETVRQMTFRNRKQRITSESLTFPLTSSKVLQEVEEQMEVIALALGSRE